MSKSSRARTRERKKQRSQQRQRNRRLMMIGAVIVGAVVIGVLFLLANQPSEAPIPDGVAERYADFEKSFDEDGFPVLGDPDAPVSVVEYSGFSCTYCEEFHENVFPEILKRVEQGHIRFTYVPLPNGSIPNSEGANRAALCAGQQEKFWEMHDVLFFWNNRFVNTAFQGNRLTTGAEALGLNMSQFTSCFDSAEIGDILSEAISQGVSSTPTIQINGTTLESEELTVEGINAAIDARLPNNTDDEEETEPVVEEIATEEAVEATQEADMPDVEAEATQDAEAETESGDDVEAEATEEAQGD